MAVGQHTNSHGGGAQVGYASRGPVAPDTVGEICVRGYLVMTGYFEMPEATAATIEPYGWLRTGDLGQMDERGYTRIEGRLKDILEGESGFAWTVTMAGLIGGTGAALAGTGMFEA